LWCAVLIVLAAFPLQFFPLDYIALASVALFCFVATLYGMFRIGIRFAGFQVLHASALDANPPALNRLCAMNADFQD